MPSNRLWLTLSASYFVGVFIATTASAGPVFYTDETDFNTDASNVGLALDFEPLDTHPTSNNLSASPSFANFIEVSSNTTNSNLLIPFQGYGSGKTANFSLRSGSPVEKITFNFDSPINAFGIDVFDIGNAPGGFIDNPATDFKLETAGGQTTLFSNALGSDGNERFAGVIDTDSAFTSVTFSGDVDTHGFTNKISTDRVFLDNIRSASIFEPDTLVFGDRPGDQSNLASDLSAVGNVVTNTTTSAATGLDFTTFDAIWTVNAFSSFNTFLPALQSALDAGVGIHFTGERPCCEISNDTIQTFLNGNVIGGGIQVGGRGDAGSSAVFNPTATADVTNAPNTLTGWNPSDSGGMAGVSGDNILATIGAETVGAAFDSDDLVGGVGRVSVLMDTNWFSRPGSEPVVENIQNFLLNGATTPAQVPVPSTLILFVAGGIILAGYTAIGKRPVL